MALDHMRIRAQELRRQGTSIGSITKTLGASKSTVSYWCRDIVLSKSQINKLAMQKNRGAALGRLHAGEKKRALRLHATEEAAKHGKRDVGTLNNRDVFILGLTLYWGEGYKRGNEECGLTNTNPYIIRAFIYWLQTTYNIPPDDLILRVTVNDIHRARVRTIEKYWSKETGVPLSHFTQASFIRTKHTRLFENPETYFGTLRVKVRRGTTLRRRILGSIKEVERQITQ